MLGGTRNMKAIKDALSFYKQVQSEKVCPLHNERLTIASMGNRKEEFCFNCEKEKIENENKQLAIAAEQSRIKRETFEVLHLDSIVTDQTLLNATFENYVVTEQEEIANKKLAMEYYEHLLNGYSFNIVIHFVSNICIS